MNSPNVNENLRMRESGDKNPGALAEVERATVLPVVSLSTVKNISESLTITNVTESLRSSEAGDKNPGALAEVERETVLPVVSLSLAWEENPSEAQLSERIDRRTELNLALDLAKSEIESLSIALCLNQWFAEKVKSAEDPQNISFRIELPPPTISSLEEDLENFIMSEEIVSGILEASMRTIEECEYENLIFIKNLQPVKNFTTLQKRKREMTAEDNSPEEDSLRNAETGSIKKLRTVKLITPTAHPPTPVQKFLQKFKFKKKEILEAPEVQKLPTNNLSITTPSPKIEAEEISEKRPFLSKFSQAKSKFESKQSPKVIKKRKFEVPKRKLESTKTVKPIPTLTTPASKPNRALPSNIPLQHEPKKSDDKYYLFRQESTKGAATPQSQQNLLPRNMTPPISNKTHQQPQLSPESTTPKNEKFCYSQQHSHYSKIPQKVYYLERGLHIY